MSQIFGVFLILWLINYSAAQDANCDFYQNVEVGYTYYIYSPGYPNNYLPGIQCRWIAVCPTGYNCRLNCPQISIPRENTQTCTIDRLLVSRSGDPILAAADPYCGLRAINAVSTGQRLSVGLITSRNSPGGRFYCELTAQPAGPASGCTCGVRRQNRIVGGQETGINEYPMMAGVIDVDISQIKCGAVIITNRFVMSAAHCVVGRNVARTAIVVGEHNVQVGDSPATAVYRVQRFIIHPLYNENIFDYDVALIEVVGTIAFSDRVNAVCLPFNSQDSDLTGSKVTLLGWGTIYPGGPTSSYLQKVDVDVISQRACSSLVRTLTDRQMCTLTPGKDACQDDSGGPTLYTDPVTGLLFSVGVISSGRNCASRTDPGIHTRVSSVLSWIVQNAPYNYCQKEYATAI
ncbi:venom serine protease 34-like [Trichoplusia ni]|uniref:Venom serine protease 34-like n=1 Tax=Trichoplusia ni TaxID=7111 RepID=A0A7E5VII4_TRINI|nr:venom serine protease 34-like [Trichoplusia ni]XP_026728127.1 venom serine protease 34-like [Trichoplusia ni]